MNTMLRWSPTRQFHFHQDAEDVFERFFGGATDEADQRPSWRPAAEGRIEDGTYVIQLALPGMDPKDVEVSLMDNGLTVKGERKDNRSQGRRIEAGRGRAGVDGTCPGLRSLRTPTSSSSTRRRSSIGRTTSDRTPPRRASGT